MSFPRYWISLITTAVVILAAGNSSAERYTVALDATSLRAITPEDESLGKIYLAEIDVPRILEGKELLGAIMEIVVDVDSRTTNELTNQTPMLEVYALTEEFANELDPAILDTNSPSRRTVVIGNARSVKIDIEEVVKGYIADPNSNYGLVLGSLTNARDGLFDLKSNNGRLATITYYYMAPEPE